MACIANILKSSRQVQNEAYLNQDTFYNKATDSCFIILMA